MRDDDNTHTFSNDNDNYGTSTNPILRALE